MRRGAWAEKTFVEAKHLLALSLLREVSSLFHVSFLSSRRACVASKHRTHSPRYGQGVCAHTFSLALTQHAQAAAMRALFPLLRVLRP